MASFFEYYELNLSLREFVLGVLKRVGYRIGLLKNARIFNPDVLFVSRGCSLVVGGLALVSQKLWVNYLSA